MRFIVGAIFACLLLAISGVLTGDQAERKGRSYWAFFGLGFVMPFWSWLVVAALPLPSAGCPNCQKS
jgi:hypothetical protein